MKAIQYLGLLIVGALLMGSFSPAAGSGADITQTNLRILRSDDHSILIELLVPDFKVEDVLVGGEINQQISIPDFGQTSQPGYPQVPVFGTLLGVPDSEDISIEIVSAESQTIDGYRLPMVQAGSMKLENPEAGSPRDNPLLNSTTLRENRYYPDSPVQIGSNGYLRDQKIAQVLFYPVQYNTSTGDVKFYRRIQAKLSWLDASTSSPYLLRQESPEYERLKDVALLNYENLKHPEVDLRDANEKSERKVTISTPTAENPSLKVGVTEKGVYQLTFNEIIAAGLDVSGVPTPTIRLTNQGNEIPILVQDDGDGVFNTGDSVLFYGIPMTGPYTTKNIYWLSAGGINGARMAEIDGTPLSGNIPASFPNQLLVEKDSYYWQTMSGGVGQDRWFWGEEFIAPASRSYTFSLANIDSSAGAATIRYQIKGRTSDISTNPDHHTRVTLNGHEIDNQSWDGETLLDRVVSFDHSFLVNGMNTLTINGVGDTGASVDQFFFNWFEVDYQDTFVAETNELEFQPPGANTYKFQIGNFGTENAMVFDISDPLNASLYTGVAVQPIGGKYQLDFQDAAATDSHYLALTPARFKQPASLELEEASSWKSPDNGADYIIITHADFYDSVLPLADYRANETGGDHRASVVKVQDIYDEFGDGIFNPQAIKDFLKYAYESWQSPAPTYVLLVGEASYDYRGTLEPPLARTNYVPTQMIEGLLLGQTAYDNWFAQISGDDYIPDMVVGRMPARSASEAADMVNKAIYYEQNPPSNSWNTKTTFISDSGSSFESISDQLVGSLPSFYTKQKIYMKDYGSGEDPTVDISNAINSGSLTVNFIGHGTVNIWANSSVYTASDVENLINQNKLTVVTVANCLSGFFVGRANPSMAEAFIRPKDRGAVAVWAPTWFGAPADHRALLQRFYDSIFNDGIAELGSAAWTAEVYLYTLVGPGTEVLETYAFFGGPATSINILPHEEIYLPMVSSGD